MKILWTHNFNPKVLNAGNFMFNFAEGLRQKGVELDLCYLGNLRSLTNINRAKNHLQKISKSYDLIHAQYGSACALATSYVRDVPKVLSLRGSDWYRFENKLGFDAAHGLLATLMTRLSINKFDAIVAVSERMANDVNQRNPNLKLFTIPSPINLDCFKPMDMQECRKALGFENDNDYWILFTTVNTSSLVKRVELARRAVEIASQRLGGRVKIRVASGIPHHQMPVFVSSCNLVLCTSTHEGWPNSVKEALACNRPFVATDVSDLHLIAEKQHNCRICLPDADIIADNICNVLENNNSHNLSRYVSSMGLAATCDNMIDVYSELLSI